MYNQLRSYLNVSYAQRSFFANVNGLFMHFCDPNHEIAQLQQEEKE